MVLLNRLAVLGFSAVLAGCEFIHPPTAVDLEAEVVVHAVLAAGSTEAAVLLTGVGPEEEHLPGKTYAFGPGIEAISGAEVFLSSDAGTIRLEEAAPGARTCYAGYASPYGNEPAGVAGECFHTDPDSFHFVRRLEAHFHSRWHPVLSMTEKDKGVCLGL